MYAAFRNGRDAVTTPSQLTAKYLPVVANDNEFFEPTVFEWQDPSEIPLRDWIYGKHLIRRHVSATIASGAVGNATMTAAPPRIAAFLLAVFALGEFRGLAQAENSKERFQDKFQIAEIFEAADFASSKCFGLHLIEDAVTATAADLGFSEEDDDIIHSPEFNFWAERGRTNARIGYEKNPIQWCEDMWRFLGPDHPPTIKHTLLTKD